jgi:HAE1 family hydrophobic/amphiphilic exporter-1
MTTIAMVIGMLPLALASGAGAEWKNGMAWALIGGLTSSMLLTLVVVPVIYVIIDKIKTRFTRHKSVEFSEQLPAIA